MNKEIFESIKKFLAKVSESYEIQSAYLFSSYSSNNFDESSDIDIAVISSSFSGDSFRDNVSLGKLTWGIDTRIEPIAFTPEEFEESAFGKQIKKRGIEIPLN